MIPYFMIDLNPISWIATFFGWIMDLIFRGLSVFGIENIGICIIVFTIITKLILYPLTLKQSKSQKLSSVIQPEIQAVQAKYKGRENDKQAMMMQQAEIKAVYEKYGTSMTAGCLPLLIQFPIIFGLYRVIVNIPQYVPSVRIYYTRIFEAIGGIVSLSGLNEFISENDLSKVLQMARISGKELATEMDVVNFLNKLDGTQWELFIAKFSQFQSVILENLEKIKGLNEFIGLDLASTPLSYGLTNPKAWIIPILAGLSQYAASRLMQKTQPKPAEGDNATKSSAAMMNSMNVIMPIMSVVFCFSFATGIGLYWIAQAVVSAIQQLFINRKMETLDMDELIRKNLEKTNAKRAKKGLAPLNERAAEENFRKMQNQMKRLEEKRDAAVEKTKALKEESNSYYKTGSIAERAQMIRQYNEKNDKKK